MFQTAMNRTWTPLDSKNSRAEQLFYVFANLLIKSIPKKHGTV